MRGLGRNGEFGSVAAQLLRVIFNVDGADFTNQELVTFEIQSSIHPYVKKAYQAHFCINDETSAASAVYDALGLIAGSGSSAIVTAPCIFILEPKVISQGRNASQFGILPDCFEIEGEISIGSWLYRPIAISFGNGTHFVVYGMREIEDGSPGWFLADDMCELKEISQPTNVDLLAMKRKGYFPVQLIYAQVSRSTQAASEVFVV